ncbi:ABC-three component system middle component 1 [uncultured Tyzzerella sp.]|uniref:ABC-three component system middle component 1 n=1 Tax=uncultured Tyzzerella sp. TaxID=2321398 RepID=UPI002942A31E|nr:ABC-three component system middle component 1 [uncultured Tyzzerella sp.]
MKQIINKLFEDSKFEVKWQSNDKNIFFYSSKEENIVNYYILNYIDNTTFEDNLSLKIKLNNLEEEYIKFDKNKESLRLKFIKSFGDDLSKSILIDKNLSAIYILKTNDIDFIYNNKNLIYEIEESTNYFKRYVLVYTEEQVNSLKKKLNNDDKIIDLLQRIAKDKKEYMKLCKNNQLNTLYSFVIRIFSKIPFLKYEFEESCNIKPLEEIVKNNFKVFPDSANYHEILTQFISEVKTDPEEDKTSNALLQKLLSTTQINVSEKEIKEDLDKLLKEV